MARKVVSIDMGRAASPAAAARFKEAVDGATYYKFRVICAPHMGSIQVTVESDLAPSKRAAQEMLNGLLLHEVGRGS